MGNVFLFCLFFQKEYDPAPKYIIEFNLETQIGWNLNGDLKGFTFKY
jgi:hypothetical protein